MDNTLAHETIDRLITIENNYNTGKRSSSEHYQDLRRVWDDLYYSKAYKKSHAMAKIYIGLTKLITEA